MKRPSSLYALPGIFGLAVGLGATAAGAQGTRSKPPLSQQPVSLKSSPTQLELRTDAGHVEFFATGWPSALRIHGKGTGADGTLSVTDGAVSGSIGFDLGSLETGIGLRDRHMKEQYLDVGRYPRAVLTLSRLETHVPGGSVFGPVSVPFEGTLLLHGVQRPVSGQARISREDERVTGDAVFSIKLADFGIDVPKYLGITVAQKVDVKATFLALLDRRHDVARR
jgi:polyisoprenoid-binding protein YceI